MYNWIEKVDSPAKIFSLREKSVNMLTFHRTSILTSSAQTVVNTVNTVGVMGKGLAAAYKKRFPDMFSEYKEVCASGLLDPGAYWLWKGNEQWVLNFSTKMHWRNPSKLEYVENGLKKFAQEFEALGVREIAFPRLGCGNGGLDWGVVKPLMVSYLHKLPITIYIHDFEKKIGCPEHEDLESGTIFSGDFEGFLNDIHSTLMLNKGRLSTLAFHRDFDVKIDQCRNLLTTGQDEGLLADEDDLYRIWSVLMKSPLTREDLPEQAFDKALFLFSILASLPYVRPVNISDASGVSKLAVELKRSPTTKDISEEDNYSTQGELLWG